MTKKTALKLLKEMKVIYLKFEATFADKGSYTSTEILATRSNICGIARCFIVCIDLVIKNLEDD